MKAFLFALCLSLAILPFFSCTAKINGTLAADGSASVDISTALQPRVTNLIRAVSSAGGESNGLILDGPAIASSMSDAPGIATVWLRNSSPSALDGNVRISKLNDFISSSKFISYEQRPSGGRCQININRENGPLILEQLSWDIAIYLNALMAPISTGEAQSKAEYLALLGSIYGKPISDEIAASKIQASIEFPGAITSVKGGTFSGKRADFEIPLLDLLVLETPLNYEVQWR
jgi:hypothetical protein